MPEKYSPDNPRPWDPNHPTLKSSTAPHETAGVLRMQRAGWPGSKIMAELKLRGTKLMNQMQRALDTETQASNAGRPIYDGSKK